MSKFEIDLSVDIPQIAVTPYRFEVRCGQTAVFVYEHCQVTGWSAFTWEGLCVDGPVEGRYPDAEEAIAAARTFVFRQERSRLLRAKLTDLLDT